MTRDEAIKIVQSKAGVKHFTESFVDALSGLGILKLDEPKSATDRLVEALGWNLGGRSHLDLCIALSKTGLKLVEQ